MEPAMNWSKLDLQSYNRKQHPVEPESESMLHRDIMSWCDQQWPKWIYVHSRFGIRSTQAPGVPDLIIAMPGGKTLWVECKTRAGKESTEQLAYRLMLERLGHVARVVRTFEEFLTLAKPEKPSHTHD
jgi:hypothetical protein